MDGFSCTYKEHVVIVAAKVHQHCKDALEVINPRNCCTSRTLFTNSAGVLT